MRLRALAVAGLAALVAVPAAAPGADAARKRPSKVRLKAFASCNGLVRYARHHALENFGDGSRPVAMGAPTPQPMRPTAGGDTTMAQPVAAPEAGRQGVDFSGTNVQEEGVDEPDIVKTDGARIFSVVGNSVHAVAIRGEGAPKLVGSVEVEGGYSHELLLHGNRLLVVSNAPVGIARPLPARAASVVAYFGNETQMSEIDVSDPANMKVVRTLRLDGRYVSARLTGSRARVVLVSYPRVYDAPQDEERAAIRSSRTASWLPYSVLVNNRTGQRRRRAIVACRHVRHPYRFSGTEMLTVLTIDLAKGLAPVDSDGIMSDAQTIYASPTNLYVATQRWIDPQTSAGQLPATTTAIHRFNISDPDHTIYRASGQVTGYLLNQFSLSEYKGVLRVASTEQPAWWGGDQTRQSESFVTVLDDRDGGVMVPVGRVSGLGKGERIYSVRFIDDLGYVVTFRQVDPLYTVDLSMPSAPKVTGELKILGYSAYLHPVGRDLLLGVGQDATEEGRLRGTQLNLFDVSDPREPKRLHQRVLGTGSSSEVEYDHHAFLYWPATKLTVIPVQQYSQDKDSTFSGAIGFSVDKAAGIEEVGRVTHPSENDFAPPVRRTVVAGDRVYTISDRGVRSSTLAKLADVAWVPFPVPPAPQPQR